MQAIIGNCFIYPNSRKELLSFLQYGRWKFEDMKKAGLKLTVEGDISDFLGIIIERKPDDTIHLTKPYRMTKSLKIFYSADLMSLQRIPQLR